MNNDTNIEKSGIADIIAGIIVLTVFLAIPILLLTWIAGLFGLGLGGLILLIIIIKILF
jgi:membrane protein YqaA with SNARE-associated domain